MLQKIFLKNIISAISNDHIMKKFPLILLALFILSACETTTEIEENKPETTIKNPVACTLSSDCHTPMRYAIQSNCPYTSACYNDSCVVTCPTWHHSTNPEESTSYTDTCESKSDCDCSDWDINGKYPCECIDNHCASIVEEQTEDYREIKMNLSNTEDIEMNPARAVDEEIEKLKNKGTTFSYNKENEIEINQEITKNLDTVECRKKAKALGITLDINWARCHPWEDDLYIIGKTTEAGDWSVFKNGEKLFTEKMRTGTDSVMSDIFIVNNSPAFVFFDPISEEVTKRNTWYKGETLNEKYGMEETSYPFVYLDKLGFVAQKDGQQSIYFNNQKVVGNFDNIQTSQCCAVFRYPIKIDRPGNLLFLGKRGNEYILTETNLADRAF